METYFYKYGVVYILPDIFGLPRVLEIFCIRYTEFLSEELRSADPT